MINRKFIYGLTLGIVGTTLYRSCKQVIKSFDGVSNVKNHSKEIIKDIKNEAQENLRDIYNNQKEYFKKPSHESSFYSNNKNNLIDSKQSIEDLEHQITMLKNQMNEFSKKMTQL